MSLLRRRSSLCQSTGKFVAVAFPNHSAMNTWYYSSKDPHNIMVKGKIKDELSGLKESKYSATLMESK